MDTVISHSPEATERLGFEEGRRARAGWVYGLTGPLGAGKTCWVKGLARGLGIKAVVRSPTYALVNELEGGRVRLTHVDLYRLETQEQIVAAGLESVFFPRDGVTVVEWFERWAGPRPPRLCRVHLQAAGEHDRRVEVTYEPAGP